MDCVGIIDLTGDEVRCQHRREVRVDDIVVLGRGHRKKKNLQVAAAGGGGGGGKGYPMSSESRRVAIGMMFVALSGVIFAFMSVLTRMASDAGMPSMEIVWVSGCVRWLGLVGSLWHSGASPLGPPQTRTILVLRSLCGMIAFSCATYAFGVMPIGDATTIFLTAPIWAAVLGRIVVKEILHPFDVVAILGAVSGVVLVARPEALFGREDPETIVELASGEVASSNSAGVPGAYVVLVGAVFAGSVAVLVRLLKKRGNVHPAVIAHAYAFITMVAAPAGLLLPGQSPRLTTLRHPALAWSLCVCIGVLAVPNQLLVNAGLLRTPAALGSMMRLIDVCHATNSRVVAIFP